MVEFHDQKNPALERIDADVKSTSEKITFLFLSGKFNREELSDNMGRLREIRTTAYGALIDLYKIGEDIEGITGGEWE